MAEPKIYTRNYITADNVYTISHGSSTKANLYDYDKDTKFLTTGANSDATTVSLQVDFYEGSVAISRTIDTLMLLNHNLKTWTAYYWDGSAWQSWATESADAAANTIKSNTSRTTLKIKIEVTATQTVDAEKYLGELVVCALLLNIGTELESYEPNWREKAKELVMGDGSIHTVTTRFTSNRTQKYGAKVSFRFLALATVNSLLSIKQANQPFLWYPESTQRVDDIYLVRWAGPFKQKYATKYKTAGYVLEMDLREV